MTTSLDLALRPLNRLINLAVKLDPQTQAALTKYQNQCLAIELVSIKMTLYFLIKEKEIQLLSHYDLPPTTKLSGEMFSFVTLLLDAQQPTLSQLGIHVEGDPYFAQNLQQLLQRMDIDWEEQLSRLVGDQLAHPIHQQLTNQYQFITTLASTFNLNLVEYLQEEICLLPTPLAVEDFIQDVDIIRNDIERLSARITRLNA